MGVFLCSARPQMSPVMILNPQGNSHLSGGVVGDQAPELHNHLVCRLFGLFIIAAVTKHIMTARRESLGGSVAWRKTQNLWLQSFRMRERSLSFS